MTILNLLDWIRLKNPSRLDSVNLRFVAYIEARTFWNDEDATNVSGNSFDNSDSNATNIPSIEFLLILTLI